MNEFVAMNDKGRRKQETWCLSGDSGDERICLRRHHNIKNQSIYSRNINKTFSDIFYGYMAWLVCLVENIFERS